MNDYRFDNFSIKIMAGDMRFSRDALRPGQHIPDLNVILADGSTTTLYHLANDKPLLLVTGSITCPMTVSSIEELNSLKGAFADKLTIVLVYVREAHPGENFPQPQNLEDKTSNANRFKEDYDIQFPVIVDDLDGELHLLLDVLPNSAHLIDNDGEIITQCLWMGDSHWLAEMCAQLAEGSTVNKPVSQRMIAPFLRGAGYIHSTLKKAGNRANRELLLGAPPVGLLSRTAALFTIFPQDKRGTVAAIALLALMAVIFGLIAF